MALLAYIGTSNYQTPPPIVKPLKSTPRASGSVLDTLHRIRQCESGNNPSAKNPTSTAGGTYQFLNGTWNHYAKQYWGTLEGHSKYNAIDSEALAVYVGSTYGFGDWESSSGCWLV